MKTPRLSSIRTVLVGAVVLASSASFAVDTVTFSGTVQSDSTASVSGAGNYNNQLALGGRGTATAGHTEQIADVTVTTNVNVNVELVSTNSGELKGAIVGNTAVIAYTAAITANGVAPVAGDWAAVADVVKPVTPGATGATELDLHIKYNQPATIKPDTYSDTIQVTVTAS